MRVFGYILMLFCLSALHSGCFNRTPADRSLADSKQLALADSILWYFEQEEFDKMVRHFDDKLKIQLSEEQLAVIWAQLNTQFGKYTNSEFYGTQKLDAVGDRVVYQSHFGSQKLYLQLVFGKDNRVIGLFFKTQPS